MCSIFSNAIFQLDLTNKVKTDQEYSIPGFHSLFNSVLNKHAPLKMRCMQVLMKNNLYISS